LRAGYNPTRRSRNIGTAKQGHGQNNKLVIPSICHDERSWQLQLAANSREERIVAGRTLLFLTEHLSSGFEHACSIDDVCRVLEFLPASDWQEIGCIVFRQPTAKQLRLRPAWGRMFYYGCVGLPGKPDIYAGPLIILEAQNCSKKQIWSRAMSLEWRDEQARLLADGHIIAASGKSFEMSSTLEAVRATQLFRTLLHEVGHWHDYQQRVELPSENENSDYGELSDAYFARTSAEREAYAHRYADRSRKTLLENGLIPF
jgi:hypothetical protein